MSPSYYRPSGQVSRAALPAAARFALVILPAGWAYAWLIIHLHFVLNVFVAFAFSFFIGWMVWRAMEVGQVRSARWSGRTGTVFSLLGWYGQWAAWLALVGKHASTLSALERFASLAADPLAMTRAAAAILPVGTFSIGDWRVTGAALAALWLLELGMHLLLPSRMAKAAAAQPFCESATRWADKQPVPTRFLPVDPAAIVSQVEADPQQVRQLLTPLQDPDAEHAAHMAKAVLYRCAASDSYLSLFDVVRTMNKHGRLEEKETPIFEYLRLPGIDPDELLAHWAGAAAGGEAGIADDDGERAIAPDLETALAHLKAERFKAALNAAVPSAGAEEPAMRADAVRICALACSRLGRWPEARGYWQALVEDEPTAHNVLQAATSSVMAGELADGIRLVAQARERNDETGDMPSMLILTNFVSALTGAGHVREAMPYVDDIRQAYLSAGTTDSHLLYMSGMPFFSVFLDKSLPVVRTALDARQARRWYTSMLPRLDEAGQAELSAWLESVFEGEPGPGMHA